MMSSGTRGQGRAEQLSRRRSRGALRQERKVQRAREVIFGRKGSDVVFILSIFRAQCLCSSEEQ